MNNQTIDGVLVSRELLERAASRLWADGNYNTSKELGALLDAPAVQWLAMEVNGKPWVIKDGPNADKWRAMGYELLPVEPTAKPQGDPIYQVMYRGDGGGGWSDAEKDNYDMKVPHPKHWRTRIVYAGN